MNVDLFFERNNRSLQWITKGIILFWAIWSLLVALSDTVNLLQHIHLLSPNWAYSSGNYDLITQLFSIYKINHQPLFLMLYFIIIVFAWIITFFFWRAALTSKKNLQYYLQRCYIAFLMIFAIDACFVIADEIFIQYTLEHGHIDRLNFKLITFLVFFILAKQQHTSVMH